ncbi:MAG: hypothetical protein Q9163_002269 [Psora crenata]
MAKTPKQKLAVDGTAKLAAKAKPNDKHENPDLTIEQATLNSPRESRKRAGEYFDFEGEEEDGAEDSGKAADSKRRKPRKTNKPAPTDNATKGAKTDKAKRTADDETVGERVKAKVERPVRSRKAKSADKDLVVGPSGDTAEVPAPATATASKKAKSADKDLVVGPSGDTAEVPGPATATAWKKEKKGKAAQSSKNKDNSTVAKEDDSVADTVAADKDKPSRTRKEKAPKIGVVVGPSEQTPEADGRVSGSKVSKPKKAKQPPKDKPETAKPSKSTKKDDVGHESSKARGASKVTPETANASNTGADGAANNGRSKSKTTATRTPTSEGNAEMKPKPKKTKKQSKKDAAQPDDATVPADLAMDQTAFESLLDSGKDKVPEGSKVANAIEKQVSKAKKETKKATEKPKKAAKSKEEKASKAGTTEPEDIVEKAPVPAEPSAPESGGSKKRKASAAGDAETVKSQILEPLSEYAAESAKKKQKKDAGQSIGESLGEIVHSGLEAATHSANSLRESLGGLTGGTEQTITSAAPEVASILDDAKSTLKAAATKGKGKAKAAADDIAAAATPGDDEGESSDSETDDQTAALLKGFESSDDDEPAEGEGFKEGQPIPAIPNTIATNKQLQAIQTGLETEAGVVFLGRIPHGFYEHQMRSYFTQFGPVRRLRLSRSRKTGRSKHYAFLEFQNEEVAKIVAATMDNYLMFGHILKCKMIPKENQHEGMWKGANKRFKRVPWNKIEGRKLEVPVGKSQWAERKEREEKKRAEKLEQTKAIGYEFVAPAIKSADEVQKKIDDTVAGSISGSSTFEQEKSLVTAADGEERALIVSEEVKIKRTRKDKKGVVDEVATTAAKKSKRTLVDGAEAAGSAAKKTKKAGKKAAAS